MAETEEMANNNRTVVILNSQGDLGPRSGTSYKDLLSPLTREGASENCLLCLNLSL